MSIYLKISRVGRDENLFIFFSKCFYLFIFFFVLHGSVISFSDIPSGITEIPGTEKRFFVVNNLLPNNGYTFRVAAKNDVGVGLTSKPKGISEVTLLYISMLGQ